MKGRNGEPRGCRKGGEKDGTLKGEGETGRPKRHRKSKREEKGGTYRVYTRSLALLPEFHPLHLYFGDSTLPMYILCVVLCF